MSSVARAAGLWVLACLWTLGASGAASEGATGAAAPAVLEEERQAARELAVENERLRGEVARLQEKQAELTVSLAEALAELDLARAREAAAPTAAPRRSGEAVRVSDARVLDVNPALRMAVLDAGQAAGVEPGVSFAVVREGRVVTRLRVVDVRERIAGAVQEGTGPLAVQRGDRAVLGR